MVNQYQKPRCSNHLEDGVLYSQQGNVSVDCRGAQSVVLLGGKGDRGVSFQPVARTGDILSLCQRLGCRGSKDCRKTASRSDTNLKTLQRPYLHYRAL